MSQQIRSTEERLVSLLLTLRNTTTGIPSRSRLPIGWDSRPWWAVPCSSTPVTMTWSGM